MYEILTLSYKKDKVSELPCKEQEIKHSRSGTTTSYGSLGDNQYHGCE